MEKWNAGGTCELLRYIQERSDDIEKIVIPQYPCITFPASGEQVEAGLVIHLIGGDLKIIPNKQDAEAVLNDGILHRMRIRIELGR